MKINHKIFNEDLFQNFFLFLKYILLLYKVLIDLIFIFDKFLLFRTFNNLVVLMLRFLLRFTIKICFLFYTILTFFSNRTLNISFISNFTIHLLIIRVI